MFQREPSGVLASVIMQSWRQIICLLNFVSHDAGSVSDDYLHYMLLQFPTNVTGWICHTLVTSSLLKACQSCSNYWFFSQRCCSAFGMLTVETDN